MKVEIIDSEKAEKVSPCLLAAVSYQPKVLRNDINNRRFSALVYVVKGKYIYCSGGEEIVLNKDSCIYLPPYGQRYSYEIVSDETETMQVDFELTDEKGEQVALSRLPRKIESNVERLKTLMERLIHSDASHTVAGRLELKSRMLMLLSLLLGEDKNDSKAQKKIAPALYWMQKNYREPFDAGKLSQMCDLSQSQLRRLFKTVTGMSPLEYRNNLRIHAAERLLAVGDLNVSEVAFATGFEDIYAFSHAFKKIKGIAPSLYKGEGI